MTQHTVYPPLQPNTAKPGYQQSALTLLIGSLVAVNFAIAKFAVMNGMAPIAAFYWQLLGAAGLLIAIGIIRKQSLTLHTRHIPYYVVAGLFGVSGPNLVSNWVLMHIPASTFTVLVTLSPLFTFGLAAIFERQRLSGQRLLGILLGLAAVWLITAQGLDTNSASHSMLLLALLVPFLLACGNVYRSKAYPTGSDALSLAIGMLVSQVIALTPVYLLSSAHYTPSLSMQSLDAAIVAMAVISALSYLLTFRLQQLTDSVGFSQVGYFVTLTGVAIGILLFDEQLSAMIMIAIVLLFSGLAITNGHLPMHRWMSSK